MVAVVVKVMHRGR